VDFINFIRHSEPHDSPRLWIKRQKQGARLLLVQKGISLF